MPHSPKSDRTTFGDVAITTLEVIGGLTLLSNLLDDDEPRHRHKCNSKSKRGSKSKGKRGSKGKSCKCKCSK